MEKSKGTGFEKMVYLGLSLSASLFTTPLPANDSGTDQKISTA